jgi:hypothetical protein
MGISQRHIVSILRFWNFDATSSLQYALEKKNYLINTILYFATACKIVLFVFFVKSLDALSNIVPGAMCCAGVVGANAYGNVLLLLKVLIMFGFGVWIVVNRLDLNTALFVYLKPKYYLFSVLFTAVTVEFLLEIVYFSHIPLNVPVFCCSTVFQAPRLPFGYTQTMLVTLFYGIFCAIVVLNALKHMIGSFTCNLLFLFVAYYAITYFFGLYVYEMPNHKCPYCMLQKEYYYIGYLIWGGLFLGVFFGIAPFLIERITHKTLDWMYRYSTLLLTLCVIVCSAYVIKYYWTNGVFL